MGVKFNICQAIVAMEILFHSLNIEDNYVDFCDEIEIIPWITYHLNNKF